MHQRHEVTEVRYELAPDSQLAAEVVCAIHESAGWAIVRIRHGHATVALCESLNTMHELIHKHGYWIQDWDESSDRSSSPAQGLAIAEARWVSVPSPSLPEGVICLPAERAGSFTWFIREGHASPRLIEEMNGLLRRVVGDGLWRQRWTDSPPEAG